MNINCLNPVIIKNKSWHTNKVQGNSWTTYIRHRMAIKVPSPREAKIKLEELDSCYYLNSNTGEMIPVYIAVPCNHCIICRDKKAIDWATRCTIESNYHVNCPWWITLTYNDIFCPEDGLNKRHLQLFLKRLRERVSRVVCEDIRLRFVAVGEYGGNTARPHYHMELFGMPIVSAKEVLALIENAWSTRISYKRFISILSKYGDRAKDFTFIREDKNGKPLYYLRNGFAYVKPAHDNTPLYLAKYMFKPEINTPENCTPNFCLASRKNGIGYDYIVEYSDYHRNNPNQLKLIFKNIHTGKLCNFSMPQYFKDYFFPTPSKIIPTDVKKSYDSFQEILCCYELIKWLDNKEDIIHHDDIDSMICDLNNKYPFFRHIKKSINFDFKHRLFCAYKEENAFEQNETFTQFKHRCMIQLYGLLMHHYEYCMSLDFDTQKCLDTLYLRDKYKASVTTYMNKANPPSPVDRAYQLQKEHINRKSKDLY